MSELPSGVPSVFTPAQPRLAAVAVLVREGANGLEVLWIRRGGSMSFAGGFYAFPGGKVDRTDRAVSLDGQQDEGTAAMVAAARELFEEVGVLVGWPAGQAREELEAARRLLLAGERTFSQVLKQLGHTLTLAQFQPAGRWVTPDFLHVRFDARFFLVPTNHDQDVAPASDEISEAEWIDGATALARWRAGTALLHPPNLHVVRELSRHRSIDRNFIAALQHPPDCHDGVPRNIEFSEGIRLFPVRSATLPPATHTNVYIVGDRHLLVVDPGCHDDDELARLVAHLLDLQRQGGRVVAVVLTHHHRDHTSGWRRVSQALGCPMWCHPTTGRLLGVEPARALVDGDRIELPGGVAAQWLVLHTPGHAPGHICLVDESRRAALVGDMAAGVGTILVEPPEGNMREYVEQLGRLRDLQLSAVYPAHGPALVDGYAKFDEYLKHRRWREEKVKAAVGVGQQSFEEVLAASYDDVAENVLPLARRSLLAILEKLQAEGVVSFDGATYRMGDGAAGCA